MPQKPEYPPLLKEGLHPHTIDELEKLCVLAFSDSTVRQDIMAGFLALYERLIQLEVQGELWVDGSFLTHKPDPADIDFMVLVSHDDFFAAEGARKDFFDWLIDNEDEPRTAFSCHTQLVLFADEATRNTSRSRMTKPTGSAFTASASPKASRRAKPSSNCSRPLK